MNFITNLLIMQSDIQRIVDPLMDLISIALPVLLGLVGSLGAIWCIVLGVKYAKAEDPQEHEKAKNALKNAIIGFVLIFVLLIMLQVGVSVFTNYWSTYNYQ